VVPDLVDALGELPAVRGPLVAVVVDGVVQFRRAVEQAADLGHVRAAGRGVTVQLDDARVGVLDEELDEVRHPLAPGADLLLADELGGDIGHAQRAVRCEQRRGAIVVAHHRRVGELAAQRLDLDAIGDGLKVVTH
jgi:hypothetical protein